jgi:hypothetical protein
LVARVVLVAIDIPAELVLLVVDLGLLFIGQIAAVGFAVLADFAVQIGFFVLQVRRLTSRKLA